MVVPFSDHRWGIVAALPGAAIILSTVLVRPRFMGRRASAPANPRQNSIYVVLDLVKSEVIVETQAKEICDQIRREENPEPVALDY